MTKIDVRVKLVGAGARPPSFAKPGDACADLCVCEENGALVIYPGKTAVVYTGCCLEIPCGYEGLVRGRSGLSAKGIVVLPGVVDSGYRGRVGIIVFNASSDPFRASTGDRIAQLAIRKAPEVSFVLADELSDAIRGDSGFGSSGVTTKEST